MYDLLIRGGYVVTPRSTAMLDVAVNGETIAAIEEPGTLEKMSSTVDALQAGQSGVGCGFRSSSASAFKAGAPP